MGAGFGHTHTVYNKRYAALAFSHGDGDIFELSEEYVLAQNAEIEDPEDHFTFEEEVEHATNCLREDLMTIKTVAVTFKGRTFDVEVDVEASYNGDDLCLVQNNLWDAYTDVIEDLSQEYNALSWQGVAKYEDDVQAAFELALCEAVLSEYPYMWVRQRTCGWCGTSYKPVAEYILDLKKQ